jgi:hypothetical protein
VLTRPLSANDVPNVLDGHEHPHENVPVLLVASLYILQELGDPPLESGLALLSELLGVPAALPRPLRLGEILVRGRRAVGRGDDGLEGRELGTAPADRPHRQLDGARESPQKLDSVHRGESLPRARGRSSANQWHGFSLKFPWTLAAGAEIVIHRQTNHSYRGIISAARVLGV